MVSTGGPSTPREVLALLMVKHKPDGVLSHDLGPHGLVAREAHARVFYDSKHAAGACLGTFLARTHV